MAAKRGRPPAWTEEEKQIVQAYRQKNPNATSAQVANHLKMLSHDRSQEAVRQYITKLRKEEAAVEKRTDVGRNSAFPLR